MNFTKILFSLVFFASILFSPLILVVTAWHYIIDETYQTAGLATLLFTISLFLILFIFEKIWNETIELWKDTNLNQVDKFIQNKHIIDISVLIILIPLIILLSMSIPFLFLFLFILILLFKIYIDIFFGSKYNRYLKKEGEEEEEEYFKLKNFEIKENAWKDITLPFTEEHKKTSLSLIKKNGLHDKLEWKYKQANMINIFNLKHKIGVLQTLQEVLVDIREAEIEKIRKKDNLTKDEKKKLKKDYLSSQEETLSKLIFKSKLIQANMSFIAPIRFLGKLFVTFIILALFSKLSLLLFEYFDFSKNFIELVIYDDTYLFLGGIGILIAVIPLGYLYFTFMRFYSLQLHTTRHNSWIVFVKNIFLYIATFSVSILLTILSIYILSKSGLEYNQAFHFLSAMILPTVTLQDIPAFIAHTFKDDVVFGIFVIKMLFLVFIFTLGMLFIKQLIEIYVEKSDNSNSPIYSIPSEFARFFAYLILSVFTIVLLYGTVFINYPALQDEYNECKDFLKPSQAYLQSDKNSTLKSSITGQYCRNLQSNEDNYTGEKKGKNSSLYNDCTIYLDYNISKFHITESEYNKYEKSCSLGANHCYTIMKYYNIDKNGSMKESDSKAKRTFADYLPLSIFLALFGVVTMIASKHLLENYFSGLSLRIDPNYEEGERVRIDGGEMLVVQDIGFRATTFYSISSNAKIVMPHQQLSKSIIINYTQPTLDYREKITIHVPDKTRHGRNIPKEAEKVLLLAAFIATGVKKPRLLSRHNSDDDNDNNIEKIIKEFKEHLSSKHEDKTKLTDIKKIIKDRENEDESKAKKINELIYNCENVDNKGHISPSIEQIWKFLNEKDDDNKPKEREDQLRTKLFLYKIYDLIHNTNKEFMNKKELDKNEKKKKEKIQVIKKIFASIITVLYDYETEANNNLHHSVDKYCMKRKIYTLYNYDINDKPMKKSRKELSKISKYLVDLSYYYFMLSKQIWELKSIDKSNHQKNNYDDASIEILDVPRVTSAHKRDIEGAYWEVNLLVTVELGEQSDEVVHHINMYIDDLWDIFDLPSRCTGERNKKT